MKRPDMMPDTRAVLEAEDRFFAALLTVDRAGLERLLAPDFLRRR